MTVKIKGFITITAGKEKPFKIYIRASAIEAVHYSDIDRCTKVAVPTHNNGGYRAVESVDEVLAMIGAADEQ